MWAKCLVTNGTGSEERLDYIANTTGTRPFPWRVMIVSDDDKQLLNNELVYLLSEPNQVEDPSWIKAGKSAWEWWHKGMLTSDGKADPANGIPANGQENNNANWNYEFYKYYVDFAAENNILYMTLDAGGNLGGDLRRLCRYAESKGVKLIVWTWASHTHENLGWIESMKNTGVSGVKIDFFDRNDQDVMTWGRTFAEELAKNQMIGIFHGCPIPTGLNRTYPNILNFEAVNGNEVNFWDRTCTPDYHVLLPFIRSLAGPIEFTPGSMRNVTERQFYPVDRYNVIPSSMGTRAHELSMYVIFDQWLGFLCDAPTEYRKYPEILDFLSTVPTVWDKTIPLNSRLGEYILTAKQTGNNWYVGGMTNWTARDIEVDFSFLAPGRSYKARIIKDGNNAGNYPTRTTVEEQTVTNDSKLIVSMAKGGGFVIRLLADDTSVAGPVKSSASVLLDREFNRLDIRADYPIRSVEVFNPAGQLVMSCAGNQAHIQYVDISGLIKGIYIVKINTKEDGRCSKFIY
jgi:alpha-glucosidase